MFVVGTCRDVYAAVQHKVPSWPCSIPHRRNCYQSRYSTCGISISQSHRLRSFHAYKCHWSQDQRPVKELLCIRHIHIYIHNIFNKTQIFSLEPAACATFSPALPRVNLHVCLSDSAASLVVKTLQLSHSGTMPLRCLTQKTHSFGEIYGSASECKRLPCISPSNSGPVIHVVRFSKS